MLSPSIPGINNRTSYLYDALNRKTVTIDQRSGRVTTMYDLAGNVTGIQDPATPNNLTSYLYDALNRRTVTIDRTVTTDPSNPTLQRTTVLYDAHNNVTQTTDRNLRVRQFSYDALDRQRQEIWLSSGTPIHTITMDFDAPGRLTQVADPRATYTYGYDDLDRRTSISNAASSGIPTVVLAQGFDARDRRTTLAVTRQGQNDFRNTYTYDALGRLTSVTQSQQTPGATVAYKRVDLDYNKLDQLLTVTRYGGLATLPNLVVRSEYFAYDDLNRLKGLAHKNPAGTALASYSWDFDKRDRMTAVTYLYGTVTFTYDPTNQVLTASHVYQQGPGSGNEQYGYDGNGNRTGDFQAGAGNRLTTYQSATVPLTTYTYQYDGEGNRTQRDKKVSGVLTEQVVYQWDHRNRLTYVGLYSGAGLPLTQEVWYTYDAFNRRLAKQVTVITGTTTTQYAYEGDNLAFVFSGAGANATATTRYLTGPAMDQVFADEDVSATPQPRWPLTDQIGTVRELVNNSAQVLKALRYDVFGNIKDDTAPGVQYAFSYTGREFDVEMGMYYYRARYYEAVTGKFISEDPKGFGAGDANFYRYVHNNPTNATDPDGLEPVRPGSPAYDRLKASSKATGDASADVLDSVFIPDFDDLRKKRPKNPATDLFREPVNKNKQWLPIEYYQPVRCIACHWSGVLQGRHVADLAPNYQWAIMRGTGQTNPYTADLALKPWRGGDEARVRVAAGISKGFVASWDAFVESWTEYDRTRSGNPDADSWRDLWQIIKLPVTIISAIKTGVEVHRDDPDFVVGYGAGIASQIIVTKKVGDVFLASPGTSVGNTRSAPARGRVGATESLVDAARRVCFPAGTLVSTGVGLKRIEELTTSDEVWAFDHKRLVWRLRKVLQMFTHNHHGPVVTVEAGDEKIEATGGHPFWVVRGESLEDRPPPKLISAREPGGRQEGRWVLAKDLRVGDALLLRSGERMLVAAASTMDRQLLVYNIHVEE